MSGLYDLLTEAQGGEAIAMLGREFKLTPQQTEAAVMALLPAISAGLKQSTATPEGLGNLFATMGQRQDLHAMHLDPRAAFSQDGHAAGNDVLSVIFGSPEVTSAVADEAQRFSGVSSDILKKMLPVIAGMLMSGLMGGKSGQAAAPQGQAPSSPAGGALGDILGQIFGRGMPGSPGGSAGPRQDSVPKGQPLPIPPDPGTQPMPGGDILGQILQELQKGIQEGRIKPVIIEGGSFPFPLPSGQGGSVPVPMPDRPRDPAPPGPKAPGGDILGQILRDMLGGGTGAPSRVPQGPGRSPELKDLSDLSKQLGVMDNVGAAVFGDRFEVGRDVEQDHVDNIQGVLDRFFGARPR